VTHEVTELAWAAGFYDGEGHISFKPELGSVQIQVVQCGDPSTLKRFQRAIGGFGNILGPYDRGNAKHKPRWAFLTGKFEHAQAIIAMLWKFMSEPKRTQAMECLLKVREYDSKRTRPWKNKNHHYRAGQHKRSVRGGGEVTMPASCAGDPSSILGRATNL
jgi:hypothetical protein